MPGEQFQPLEDPPDIINLVCSEQDPSSHEEKIENSSLEYAAQLHNSLKWQIQQLLNKFG